MMNDLLFSGCLGFGRGVRKCRGIFSQKFCTIALVTLYLRDFLHEAFTIDNT